MNGFSNDQVLFTFSDMRRLFLRHLKSLKRVALVSGCAVFFCLLLTTPKYILEGTFNKSSSQKEPLGRMMHMFQQFIEPPNESSVIAIVQSHTVIRQVIEDLGTQIEYRRGVFLFNALTRVIDNLWVEFGNKLSDPERFVFRDVRYEGESSLKVFIKLQENGLYQLYDQKKQLVGESKLGKEVSSAWVNLTLRSAPLDAKLDRFYGFTCHPMEKMVKRVRSRLKMSPSRLDKNILQLTFICPDRRQGAEFLNHLMLGYQGYLKRENDQMCRYQIAYLQKRQEELIRDYDQALLEQTSYLRENLTSGGFISFAQELETLLTPKNLYTSKLLDLDLQQKRLRDSIDTWATSDQQGEEFVSSPKPQQAHWIKGQHEAQALVEKEAELQKRLDHCEFEQLKTPTFFPQGSGADECTGLSLETAQRLLVESTQERDALQVQMRELAFLREQLGRPDFEMSSLAGVFDDAVMRDIMHKASAITLQLKDENNRSVREQERLMETLQAHKDFCSHHLLQISELKKLKSGLLGEKISSLQKAIFELLQEEKGLLKGKLVELNGNMKELPEKWRRESLLTCRKELGMTMLGWVSQLVETKSLGQYTFQIQSKPLDWATLPRMPQSPKAFLLGFLAALVGPIGCYLVVFSKALFKGLPVSVETLRLLGMPVSGEVSKFCNASLLQLRGGDLETLRRVVELILSKRIEHEGLLAVNLGGNHPDFSFPLAELLVLRGLTVVVVRGIFDQVVRPEEVPGLWQYLHGQMEQIPLRRHLTFDVLPSGGTSRHGLEILCAPKAQNLLAELKKRYDVVLLHTSADPAKVEGVSLLKCADVALVTVQQEKKEDLGIYWSWAQQKGGSSVTFVYADE